MSAVATKPRTRKPSAPIAPATPFWYAPSLAARTAILEVLAAARDHEFEDDDRTSDAWRVAKAAHAPAEAIVVDGFPPPGASDLMFRNDIASSAFDIRAFLTAALNYPDQRFCLARATLLECANRIATALANLHTAGPDQSMVADVYAAIEHRAPTARLEPAKTVALHHTSCAADALGVMVCDAGKPVDEACGHYQHALAVVEAAVQQVAHDQERSALVYAARNLMRRDLGPFFEALTSEPDEDALNDASAALSVVVGLLEAAAFANDDSCLWGAHTLAGLSKEALDEYIEKVERSGAAS